MFSIMSVVMSPMRIGTKNDCTGNSQQQFTATRSERTIPKFVWQIWSKTPKGRELRFTVLVKASSNLTETDSMQTGNITMQFETGERGRNMVLVLRSLDPGMTVPAEVYQKPKPRKQEANFSSDTEVGVSTFPWDGGKLLPYYMSLHPRDTNLNSPSRLLCRMSPLMQLACVLFAAALIPRNPINYPSPRTISLQNALVMLYQEVIVVYFTFDLLCASDRLLLGGGGKPHLRLR